MTKNKPKPTWKAWTTVEGDAETVHVLRANGKSEIHLAQRMEEGGNLGLIILALIGQVQKFADANPKACGNPDNPIQTFLVPDPAPPSSKND